jgi:hypothetical protein
VAIIPCIINVENYILNFGTAYLQNIIFFRKNLKDAESITFNTFGWYHLLYISVAEPCHFDEAQDAAPASGR